MAICSPARPSSAHKIPTGLRLLLVEDNPGDARLAKEILQGGGEGQFQCIHVNQLQSAISQLTTERFDIILLDLSLPDANGLDALHQVRKHAPEIPIVILSGAGDETLACQSLGYGAQDYLIKGEDTGTILIRAIRYALERQRTDGRMAYLATHDALTDLANRTLLQDSLERALIRTRRDGAAVYILFIDLDGFKLVNDTFGHEVGDLLLQSVATRLHTCIREADTIARLGGDEFAVLLEGIRKESLAVAIAEKVVRAMSTPFDLEGRCISIGASIGVASYPIDGDSAPAILRRADAAMYQAKTAGGNCVRSVVRPGESGPSTSHLLREALRQALDKDELAVYYQPQISLLSGELIGVEALLRWRYPEWGLIGPAEFLPVAENSGLMIPLSRCLIRAVKKQMHLWNTERQWGIRVAVNMPLDHLRHPDILKDLKDLMGRSGMAAGELEIELIEALSAAPTPQVCSELNELRQLGVRIALDDFGIDSSSFGVLKNIPWDMLKLDQSLVRGLTHNSHDQAIVRSLIMLTQSLGRSIIAEGVETREELDLLRRHGCDAAQGFLLSEPLPADAMTEWLCTQRLRRTA